MTRTTLPLTSITIGDRQRLDLGDLSDLVESMAKYGLIQPIVINQDKVLIAGGRRMAAAEHLGWTEIDVVYKETLSQAQLMEMELEENLRRKEMSWQERTLGIARLHKMRQQSSALDGEKWGQRQTGEMLGVTHATVNYALKVAEQLEKEPQGVISQQETFMDAYKKLLNWDEQAALRELASRTAPAVVFTDGAGKPEVEREAIAEPDEEPTIALSCMLHNNECTSFMQSFLPAAAVDHIITDPPYGIDVDMMDQQNAHGGMNNIDSILDTHQVEDNKKLFRAMIPSFYRILKPNGFMCLWCDIMQWQLLYDLSTAAGFKVQRWPIVWDKTHACMNNAAAFNFTKSIELCLIARKGTATLVQPAPRCMVHASSTFDQKRLGSHPFIKPGVVWEFLLRHVSIQGQTIFDPFAGVGSGVLTALTMGRKVLATEISEHHYNQLVENVKQHYLTINSNTQFI